MPTSHPKLTIDQLLFNKQKGRYQLFLDTVLHLDFSMPFLATISVDTERLGDAIVADLIKKINSVYLEEQDGKPSEHLYQLLHQYKDFNRPILLPLYREKTDNPQLAAEQLLWHRDIITRNTLCLIVLVDASFYMTILTKAYDFVSYSNVIEQFTDEQAAIETDFKATESPSSGLEAFDEAEVLLLEELDKKRPHKAVLLRRYFSAAETAYQISRLEKARQYFEKAYQLASSLQNEDYQSRSLVRLGALHHRSQQYDKALENYQKALEIDRRTGDLEGEGNTLGNIGLLFYHQKNSAKAKDYLERAIKTHQALNYKEGLANHKGHIGLIYLEEKKFSESLEYIREAYQIHKELGYMRGAATQLGNMGLIYKETKAYEKALYCHKHALELDKAIGFAQGEGEDLFNLGEVYEQQGDLNKALFYFIEALSVFYKHQLETHTQLTREKIVAIVLTIEVNDLGIAQPRY
ncbi:MAG TPA: tetratricopeptide repeat protein [Saprospiraceae bacterium]|nr:tetratricopeptide repeat protein [Saprospiraceae bacterium]HMQ85759.1 tetratricopeptide repeat protein [Saprospiraceae bacterium]